VRVRTALAAAQANWHASHQEWAEAVAAYDRLAAADPSKADGWLGTPALLRVASALFHKDRPRDAAALLTGGAKRRAQDGVSAAINEPGIGITYSTESGTVQVRELLPGFPGSRAGLLVGDTIVRVNDTTLTYSTIPKLRELLAGDAGSKLRLTVRHSGITRQDAIELTRIPFVHDAATG